MATAGKQDGGAGAESGVSAAGRPAYLRPPRGANAERPGSLLAFVSSPVVVGGPQDACGSIRGHFCAALTERCRNALPKGVQCGPVRNAEFGPFGTASSFAFWETCSSSNPSPHKANKPILIFYIPSSPLVTAGPS